MIRFIASLKTPGKWLKMDAELASEITLLIPASEVAEAIKLATLKGKSFRVNIFEVGEKDIKDEGQGER